MPRVTVTVLFITGVLAFGPAIADSEIEWQQIREQQSRIDFRTPDFEGGISRFYFGSEECATLYLGDWVGPSGLSPTAEIIVAQTAPDCVISFQSMQRSLRDDLQEMSIREGIRLVLGNENTHRNTLGRITYLPYSFESSECVAFSQRWRSPFRGNLFGVYCVHEGEALTQDTIFEVLQGIGVK